MLRPTATARKVAALFAQVVLVSTCLVLLFALMLAVAPAGR